MGVKSFYYKIFCVLGVFILWGENSLYSQEIDEMLKRSDQLVFEANTLVNDSFLEAEKTYRKAISEKPSNTKSTYNLGSTYYDSGFYDEAILRLVEATQTGSKAEKHLAFHNLGNALMQIKDCQKAVEAYKNALRNNPKDDETRYNLALAQDCAKEQGGGKDNNDQDKDKDKDKEDKENQNQDDNDQNQDQDQKNKENNGDQENNNDNSDQKNDDGAPDDKNGDQKNPNNNNQQQQGQLSPQQVKNLLEAMNNEENKVQKKMNASKVKGVKIKTDKDW